MEKRSVPYGGNKESDELRKTALIKRIAVIYEVSEVYAEYKVVRTRYISPDGKVNFPYVLEVIAIPFDDIRKQLLSCFHRQCQQLCQHNQPRKKPV